jgi:hypothetical protein
MAGPWSPGTAPGARPAHGPPPAQGGRSARRRVAPLPARGALVCAFGSEPQDVALRNRRLTARVPRRDCRASGRIAAIRAVDGRPGCAAARRSVLPSQLHGVRRAAPSSHTPQAVHPMHPARPPVVVALAGTASAKDLDGVSRAGDVHAIASMAGTADLANAMDSRLVPWRAPPLRSAGRGGSGRGTCSRSRGAFRGQAHPTRGSLAVCAADVLASQVTHRGAPRRREAARARQPPPIRAQVPGAGGLVPALVPAPGQAPRREGRYQAA